MTKPLKKTVDRWIQPLAHRTEKTLVFLSNLIHWRIRLLPIVIFCACLILSVKISQVFNYMNSSGTAVIAVGLESADATNRPQDSLSDGQPTPLKRIDERPGAKTSTNPSPGTSDLTTLTDVGARQDIAAFDPLTMTPEEFQILQELAKRKGALNSQDIEKKAKKSDLEAIEKRIVEKTEAHTAAKKELKDMLDKVDHEENVGVKRLVKMMESMKPKEAAQILEGVDFHILLQIMETIKEKTASSILAQMDPKKASYLLTEMGKRKQILAKKDVQ